MVEEIEIKIDWCSPVRPPRYLIQFFDGSERAFDELPTHDQIEDWSAVKSIASNELISGDVEIGLGDPNTSP